MAEHRLKLLKRPLLRDPQLKTKYKDCITDLLDKGYAAKIPAAEVHGKTWYLSHHAVCHPGKPGKVRVVFDCSVKYRGKSLKRPDLTGAGPHKFHG